MLVSQRARKARGFAAAANTQVHTIMTHVHAPATANNFERVRGHVEGRGEPCCAGRGCVAGQGAAGRGWVAVAGGGQWAGMTDIAEADNTIEVVIVVQVRPSGAGPPPVGCRRSRQRPREEGPALDAGGPMPSAFMRRRLSHLANSTAGKITAASPSTHNHSLSDGE